MANSAAQRMRTQHTEEHNNENKDPTRPIVRRWVSYLLAFLTNTVNRNFVIGTSHLTKESQNKPDQTSPRERARTAALHEKWKGFLPALHHGFPDGKNCEHEACPVRLWTPSSSRSLSKKKGDAYRERMVQMFGEPQQYRAQNMYGPDSWFADPKCKPKTLQCMNPNLKFTTKEEMDEYFAWCESTAWNDPVKDVEMEGGLADPASEKSSSGEVNTRSGETMGLDQDLSAEVEASSYMKYMTEDMYAEPQREEEMTDAPELPISDWYSYSTAPSTTMTRTHRAPFQVPEPHLSVQDVPQKQDMNNVAATTFLGLGMLQPSPQSIDHPSSSSSGRDLATPITPPQALAPVVAMPSNSDQSRSPTSHLPDVDMLEDDNHHQPASSSQPERQSSSKGPNASSSQSQSYPLAPFSTETRDSSFCQYRHTPLVLPSLDEGDDSRTSSVPGLNNQIEDQTFVPALLCREEGPSVIALRDAIVDMSMNDGAESDWQPIKEDVLMENAPPITSSMRTTLSDEHRLYPVAKRTCLAAQSSSSTDQPASKTRHADDVYERFVPYQYAVSDKLAASQPSSDAMDLDDAEASSALPQRARTVSSAPSALLSRGAMHSSKTNTPSALESKVLPQMQSGVGLDNESISVPNAGTNSAPINCLAGKFAGLSIGPVAATQTIKKQGVSFSAAASHPSQCVGLPSGNFAPSKKPGSFGTSVSKSSAVAPNPIASNGNTQRVDMPPTTFVQSAKPSISTSVKNQMSNVVIPSPDASGLLKSGLSSTSRQLLVQSKKPGTWLDRKPKRDAVPAAPATPMIVTSDRSDAAMELDVPVNSAYGSSKGPVSALQGDEPRSAAAKPFTPVNPSDAIVNSDKNGSGPFRFPELPKLRDAGGRATQGNRTARRAGQTPIRRAARTEANVWEAGHIGRTRTGFRDRSDKERQELEGILHQVPDQFKIDVHKVIQSQVCDVVPPRSDETMRSIPDLAKTGPGASVGPHPFAKKFRSKAACRQDLTYLRELRQKTP